MNDRITNEPIGLGADHLQRRGVRVPRPEEVTDVRTGQPLDTELEMMLLCAECDVVYDDKDDWNNCPRCGDELREVKKA
jgi:uncharacterized paraquat-inducible protein A